MTYSKRVDDKPLVWVEGEVKTPPFSSEARIEAGLLLRRLQRGENVGLPMSRPMPPVGNRRHELRITDGDHNWRIVYRLDDDAVLVLDVFDKKTNQTPDRVIKNCQRRMRLYDEA